MAVVRIAQALLPVRFCEMQMPPAPNTKAKPVQAGVPVLQGFLKAPDTRFE